MSKSTLDLPELVFTAKMKQMAENGLEKLNKQKSISLPGEWETPQINIDFNRAHAVATYTRRVGDRIEEVKFNLQMLGSFNPGNNTWQWSWANNYQFTPRKLKLGECLKAARGMHLMARHFGDRADSTLLSRPVLRVSDQADCLHLLGLAGEILTRPTFGYSVVQDNSNPENPNGIVAYFLHDERISSKNFPYQQHCPRHNSRHHHQHHQVVPEGAEQATGLLADLIFQTTGQKIYFTPDS